MTFIELPTEPFGPEKATVVLVNTENVTSVNPISESSTFIGTTRPNHPGFTVTLPYAEVKKKFALRGLI